MRRGNNQWQERRKKSKYRATQYYQFIMKPTCIYFAYIGNVSFIYPQAWVNHIRKNDV